MATELEINGAKFDTSGNTSPVRASFAGAANIPGMEAEVALNPQMPTAFSDIEKQQNVEVSRAIQTGRDIGYEVQGVEASLQEMPRTGLFAECFDAGCKLTENIMQTTKDLNIGLPEPEIQVPQVSEVEHTMDPKPVITPPSYLMSSGPGGH